MTETLMDVSPSSKEVQPQPSVEELDAARELVRQARARGVALTGPDGLLKALTKTVIETVLDEEISEHLGYDKHDPSGRNLANSRNGKRSKTVLTGTVGPVDLEVPRHRDGTFEPVIAQEAPTADQRCRRDRVVAVRQGFDHRGDQRALRSDLRCQRVQGHGQRRSPTGSSREMQAWSSRPLEKVYAAIFIDAIMVKIRDGQVGNRPVYAAIGVDLDGHKDILGMWAGDGDGESAKFWMAVLTDLKNRGVADAFFVVCDGPVGAAELGEHRMADGHGPDVHHPPDPGIVSVRLTQALARAVEGPQTHLPGRQRRRRGRGPGGPR